MQTQRNKGFAAIIAVTALALASPSFAQPKKVTHTIGGVQWRELTTAEVATIPYLTKLRNNRSFLRQNTTTSI